MRAARLFAAREARVAAWRLRWHQRDGIVCQRVPALNGEAIELRARGSDAKVLWDTLYGRYHLPPPDLAADRAGLILDIGSNIGLTIADFAVRFPSAHIVGVEPDPATADIARRNISPWRERTELFEAAVWTADGTVPLHAVPGREWAARVDPRGSRSVAAISLDTLLSRSKPQRVDYLKLDIEGAERQVLRTAGGWPELVDRVKVEVHEPYTVSECAEDLRALGFRTALDDRHWSCVVGWRDG